MVAAICQRFIKIQKMKTVAFILILLSVTFPLVMFFICKPTTRAPLMNLTHGVPSFFHNGIIENQNSSHRSFSTSASLNSNVPSPAIKGVKVSHAVSLPNFNDSIINYTTAPNVNKYVVYLCNGKFPCGGWADRQKGIISSFVLAQALRRKFRVEINHPCKLSNYLSPKTIDWRIKLNELKGLSKTFIKIIDSKDDKLRQEMATIDLESKYSTNVIYFTSNLDCSQNILRNKKYTNRTLWMKKYNIRQLYSFLWDQLFQFVPELEKRFQNFTSSIARNKNSTFYCAQVRLGRNPTIPTDTEVFNSLNSVKAIWDFLFQFPDIRESQIFVTSDSEIVREIAERIFHGNILDVEGDIVHVEHAKDVKGVCDGFSKVLLDQRVLSVCDALVISRSGFAIIGAWLRKNTTSLYCFSQGKVKSCHPDKLGELKPSW